MPGLAQVCRIARTREINGKTSHEIVYAITSLSHTETSPAALLALNCEHWEMENRLHWRYDVILREDDSKIRSDTAPQALAALRSTMLQLVNAMPGPLAAIRETFAENRHHAIATVKTSFL